LSNLSHDLKTPLTVIRTSLYMLERAESPERRKEKLEMIRSQSVLLEELIQNILTLSRLERTPQMKFVPLDLNRLLREAQLQLGSSAETKNLTLEVDLDADLPPVLADEREIYRAMANLVENAIQYTPERGTVTVKTSHDHARINIEVSDTGIGIAPDELPRLFERYYRTESARSMRQSGTGLGLAIVKRIVEIHGGDIQVESRPGAGSTFRIQFPAAPDTRPV
jgi:two-component system phosphate regulon sensor histidine kinase PhoR